MSGCAINNPHQSVSPTADITTNAQRGYSVMGETKFDSCMDKFMIKEGDSIGKAMMLMIISPVTTTSCVAIGTGQVAYHFKSDSRENSLRWKNNLSTEEKNELESLRDNRGDRGLYGFGERSASAPETTNQMIYTDHGGYMISTTGDKTFINKVSTVK